MTGRALAVALTAFTLVGCSQASQSDRDAAIARAQEVYQEEKQAGVDFTNGGGVGGARSLG